MTISFVCVTIRRLLQFPFPSRSASSLTKGSSPSSPVPLYSSAVSLEIAIMLRILPAKNRTDAVIFWAIVFIDMFIDCSSDGYLSGLLLLIHISGHYINNCMHLVIQGWVSVTSICIAMQLYVGVQSQTEGVHCFPQDNKWCVIYLIGGTRS